MNAKQKIVHCRGPSNINLGVFVCSFDVCQASKPFPSINYALTDPFPPPPPTPSSEVTFPLKNVKSIYQGL